MERARTHSGEEGLFERRDCFDGCLDFSFRFYHCSRSAPAESGSADTMPKTWQTDQTGRGDDPIHYRLSRRRQAVQPGRGKTTYGAVQELAILVGRCGSQSCQSAENTSTVNPDGTVAAGGTTSMSGYTIVEADSMEAALSIAKSCPFLDVGGSLEVSELVRMPTGK